MKVHLNSIGSLFYTITPVSSAFIDHRGRMDGTATKGLFGLGLLRSRKFSSTLLFVSESGVHLKTLKIGGQKWPRQEEFRARI